MISFYVPSDEFGFLCNFSTHGFQLDGRYWPTVEHYFQAQKFAGTPHEEEIRKTASPAVAARKGRSRKRPLRPDWEDVKDDIMREAVLAKFEQHAEIRETLLSTGDDEIIEKTTRDYYWGCGTEGTGKNMLGVILMEVREKMRSETVDETSANP